MRVLVVGSGAREHALCERLRMSPAVTDVLCAPGNAGIAQGVRVVDVPAHDVEALAALARRERVDLVVVGPEAPLVGGLADRLEAMGIACFGPRADTALLEGSKGFAKDFMARHAIPTAAYARFDRFDPAADYARAAPHQLVVKADGLAAGKGVVVCDSVDQAIDALDHSLRGDAFGVAGRSVVIEERLTGPEISLHIVSDGVRYAVLGAAQDHKRLRDGDVGPNTGGMGAYSPVPEFTASMEARVCREIVEPTLRGIALEASPLRGVLFVGLMIDAQGAPRVLEYNVRFGDPECAILLARIDGDIATWMLGAAQGVLDVAAVRVRDEAALGVVIAAGGYPGPPERGIVIEGISDAEQVEGARVYHAGTSRRDDRWITAGGRVLLVSASGATLQDAARTAYLAVDQVSFSGAQVRRDIGWRAL
jgi:phosphoribosylamine---glycine ligase